MQQCKPNANQLSSLASRRAKAAGMVIINAPCYLNWLGILLNDSDVKLVKEFQFRYTSPLEVTEQVQYKRGPGTVQ